MAAKVALVTGSNKGVGIGIVRALCKQFDGDVYLTARDESRGLSSIESLKKEGLSPKFHQLNIDDQASLDRAKTFFQQNYNGIDILVNNAGIAFKSGATEPFSEQVEVTLKTNFWGTLRSSETLFPILKPHARVVQVSSGLSTVALSRCAPHLKQKFVDQLSMEQLKVLMQDFVEAAKAGNHKEKGWPDTAYGVSKIGVTVMARIQQRDMNSDPREDIVVNACCPGYVDTDMTSHQGTKTIDQGAVTPVYLALLPPNVSSPKGEFIQDKKITPWK